MWRVHRDPVGCSNAALPFEFVAFQGWPRAATEFYQGLEADNSRAYWQAHRSTYEEHVRGPMEQLLADLAPEFGEGKMFRPYRDVRFSSDKTPYKPWCAAIVGAGGYVQLSADGLTVGTGMYHLAADQLGRYRRAVADDDTGERLAEIVQTLRQYGADIAAADKLKTTPRGFPPDHPRIELLRHKGLVAMREWPIEPWLSTPQAKDYVVAFLRMAAPLHQWLVENVGPSELPERVRR